MKKILVIVALLIFTVLPVASLASGDHAHMNSAVAHEEVVDGVKATFKVISMKEHLQASGIAVPKDLKETHHMMLEFKDAKTGKLFSSGTVRVKVIGPDKSEQTKDLVGMPAMSGMGAHFGADFVMAKKGKYGVMTKFKLDGKVRSAKFWYEVK